MTGTLLVEAGHDWNVRVWFTRDVIRWHINTASTNPYGPHHAALRALLQRVMGRLGWVWCSEPECSQATRMIRPGEPWQLSHDHARGPLAYHGPAHPGCNLAERNRRWAA